MLHLYQIVETAGFAVIFYCFTELVSPVLCKYISSAYEFLPGQTKLDWKARITTLWYSTFAFVSASCTLWWDTELTGNRTWGRSRLSELNLIALSGYCLTDLWLIRRYQQKREISVMQLHHITAIVGCFCGLGYGKFLFFHHLRLISEVSTPFLVIRVFRRDLGNSDEKLIDVVNGLIFSCSFFITRILFIPLYYFQWYLAIFSEDFQRAPRSAVVSLLLCSFFMDLFNIYWFQGIFRGLGNFFFKRQRHS